MNSLFHRVLRKLVPQQTFGALSYRINPRSGQTWGGPFNGQAKRCLLFASLIGKLQPVAIVETGTYLGTTSEWLAAFQIPVFTVEAHSQHFGFARERLAGKQNVTTILDDSRTALRNLLSGPLRNLTGECIVIYLDAHWNSDLPLIEELEIIFRSLPNAAVMIDDFQVPDDLGYFFDNYGSGKALIPSYVQSVCRSYDLQLYYPAVHSALETGARRGCVILCREKIYGRKLLTLDLVRTTPSREFEVKLAEAAKIVS